MLADFPVLYVDGIVKRTLGSCILLAAVALVVTFLLGQYLAGVGVVLGLAGATVNHRLFQVSTAHYSDAEGHLQKRPYAGSVAARLGGLTIIAFTLLFFVRPMGFGMVGGLVAFQVLLMANALGALWHYQRQQLGRAHQVTDAREVSGQAGRAGGPGHGGPRPAGLPGPAENGTSPSGSRSTGGRTTGGRTTGGRSIGGSGHGEGGRGA